MSDMQGKVVLITGATNGIGRAAALALARRGATVAVAGRSQQRLDDTLAMLRAESGVEAVSGLLADLSTQAGVRQLADAFREQHDRLDILLNNAGANFRERADTADGLERTFAVNHIAYYLLTRLLLDLLQASAPARIVNVSSEAHRQQRTFDFDNLDGRKRWGMFGFGAYSQSKLANVLFTRELARRLEGSGITVNSMHPGVVNTGLFQNVGGIGGLVLGALAPVFMKTPEQGADTLIWLATAGEMEGRSGGYYDRRRLREPSAAAQDDDAARRLWALSAELCGLCAG
ncbi:MAG: SDR family NAD(P)-dependent oxidoreductase [Anaerolineaceae bacterium]|nr:SDR family NAD(P)-dependent oxidoreductase [Anaerolineaceae bacterium]MCY4023356.1 SDR family NAD(P)-dependent oxidoreductase [Anaerolineaceae bacterium]